MQAELRHFRFMFLQILFPGRQRNESLDPCVGEGVGREEAWEFFVDHILEESRERGRRGGMGIGIQVKGKWNKSARV
jgi:hypothetical protein